MPGPALPRAPRRAAAAALALVALGACGGDGDADATAAGDGATAAEGDGTTTTTPSSSASTAAPTSTMAAPRTTAATPAGTVVDLSVEGGRPVGGVARPVIDVGDEVTLRVTSDSEDELHVHGYDLEAPVGPGAPGEVTFTADLPGVWEVELHGSHQLLAQLEVR